MTDTVTPRCQKDAAVNLVAAAAVMAGPYHLLDQRALDALLPLCEQRNIGRYRNMKQPAGCLLSEF